MSIDEPVAPTPEIRPGGHWPVVDRLLLARRVHSVICRVTAVFLVIEALDSRSITALDTPQMLTLGVLLLAACFAEPGKLVAAALAALLGYALLVQPFAEPSDRQHELGYIVVAMSFLASAHLARTLWPDDLDECVRAYNEVQLRLIIGRFVAFMTFGFSLHLAAGGPEEFLALSAGDISVLSRSETAFDGPSFFLLMAAATASSALVGLAAFNPAVHQATVPPDPDSPLRSDTVDAAVCALAGGGGATLFAAMSAWGNVAFVGGATIGLAIYCVCRASPRVTPRNRLYLPLRGIGAATGLSLGLSVLASSGSLLLGVLVIAASGWAAWGVLRVVAAPAPR